MSLFIDNLDGEQLAILSSAFAIAFSKGLTSDEIEILAGFITSIGDLMALIAAKKDIPSDADTNN
jgi:hypothetical protein